MLQRFPGGRGEPGPKVPPAVDSHRGAGWGCGPWPHARAPMLLRDLLGLDGLFALLVHDS
eukprot:11213735-Lingulodinium_polyedra.AAC.1